MHSRDLLTAAAGHAADFLETLPDGRVEAEVLDADELRARLAVPLPDGPTIRARSSTSSWRGDARPRAQPVAALLRLRDRRDAARGAGRRRRGRLAWDQNAGGYSVSPAASVVEEVAGGWLLELLGLPGGRVVRPDHRLPAGARHLPGGGAQRRPRARRVGRRGRRAAGRAARAPAGQRASATSRSTARCGSSASAPTRWCRVAVDADGPHATRPRCATRSPPATGRRSCARRPATSTPAPFDPLAEIVDVAHAAGAWVHIDGAFGLWAAASPERRHLLDGYAGADSWATDGHKWLNVPHDCGLAFVADPEPHRNAMVVSAAYLRGTREGERDGSRWVPDFSRRGRGFAVYAALRSLGREGVAEMVERCCACARRFAEVLGAEEGIEILNDVVLNQVLVRFGDDDATTDAVVAAVQAEGTCWMSPTTWRGRRAMRISVCNWATTISDVDRSCAAILGAARARPAPPRSR